MSVRFFDSKFSHIWTDILNKWSYEVIDFKGVTLPKISAAGIEKLSNCDYVRSISIEGT